MSVVLERLVSEAVDVKVFCYFCSRINANYSRSFSQYSLSEYCIDLRALLLYDPEHLADMSLSCRRRGVSE